jgi:ribonuclease G
MGKELVISAGRHETKVAILEDDQLVEIFFQRANEYSLAGSIHKGRVTRVLPGMQSAFVDIGLERDAFLYVSDFFEDHEEYDKVASAAEDQVMRAESRRGAPAPAVAPAPEPEPEKAAQPAPAPEAHAERVEDDNRRGGRRSRRRRSRGRGFPESKYAAIRGEHEHEHEREPEPQPEPEPAGAAASGESFPVLPGESLAKYAHPHESDAGDAEAEELAVEDPTLGMAPPVEPMEEEETEESAAAAAESAEEERLASPEPLLEEPVADEDVENGPETPEPAEEPETAEEAVAERVEEEEEVNGGAEEGLLVAELKDEVIPENDGAVTESQEEAEAGAEKPAESEPEPEGVEPARMPVSLTATLREQGHRYPQRMSRRMRRKMRTQTYAEPETAEAEAPKETREREPREEAGDGRAAGGRAARAERAERPQQSITDLLKEGQEILVQIAKEPLGQKGARITSHIALPGRYVVYMPTVEHLGVSRKIASDEERQRLKRILQAHRMGMTGGFIVRTAGEGTPEDEIASDMRFLYNMWLDIRQKAEARPAPALIYHDLDIVSRILRDQMAEQFKTIWLDNEELYERVLRFVQRFQPGLVGRVKLYTRDTPIFDAFNVTPELEKALRPKVWLKSGGYIVINQTEALVAIDVNTGKFVGKSNRLEDTIVKTNTEAVKEIVRQVRLRDLGGIIVVDFIDMDERKNRQKVMQALEEAMRADRAPNKILQFNDFGLVAITRKRVKQSLERTLCSPCPYCEGSGYVKSVQTVVGEILTEAQKIAKLVDTKDVTLRVNPEVARFLKSTDNNYLEELEEKLGRPVLIVSDPMLQQEKFDLI